MSQITGSIVDNRKREGNLAGSALKRGMQRAIGSWLSGNIRAGRLLETPVHGDVRYLTKGAIAIHRGRIAGRAGWQDEN